MIGRVYNKSVIQPVNLIESENDSRGTVCFRGEEHINQFFYVHLLPCRRLLSAGAE